MATTTARLLGIITLSSTLVAKTGLRIGAQEASLTIGGVDNPVIRDPLTRQPYIPGSSLKGKMRSLLERVHGLEQNWSIGGERVKVHVCKEEAAYSGCMLCQLFGVPAPERERWLCQTRLRFADTFMTPDSVERLVKASTDLPYTELKAEAAIDRVTSAAVPRTMERVPARTEFGPCEIGLFIYEGDDAGVGLRWLADGLELVEADALGSSSARGSGRVEFKELGFRKLTVRDGGLEREAFGGTFPGTKDLRDGIGDLMSWAKSTKN